MLIRLKKDDIDKYIEWAYSLALDINRSSYPTYIGGIKTKEDFINVALKSFDEKNSEILLYCNDSKIFGWIHYFYLPQDDYISFHTFLTERDTAGALCEFEKFCSENFKGTLYMGFPQKNTSAVSYLKANGYELIEQSDPFVYRLPCRMQPQTKDCITQIHKDNFGIFAELHKPIELDMYWTCDRISAEIDNWFIYVYDDGACSAAIYFNLYDQAEIFGVDYKNGVFSQTAFVALVAQALELSGARGKKYLWYFAENDSERKELAKLGFEKLCEYVLFTKQIDKQ